MKQVSPLAGKPAPKELLINPAQLEREYFARRPDVDDAAQRVAFGTSGHRGTSLKGSFNEAHILAVTQAVCEQRRAKSIDGPLYVGKDTHALSAPAERTSSSIGALAVDTATGTLTYLSSTPTEKQPRGFRIDPGGRYMVVSGEKSDTISVYEIDRASGTLKLLQKYPTGKGSNWVEIVAFD